MKVLMLGRLGLMEVGGGDKVQIINTAEELASLGINVEIKTDFNFNPKDYDVIHVFQLDWTPETYFYAKKVKNAGKPLVLSPIHHNVGEVKKFDDIHAFDFRRLSRLLFKDQFKRDVFKNVYRCLFDPSKLKYTLFSISHGFKKMQRETLEMSNKVLVQTIREAKDLEKTFDVKIDWEKVVNGVGEPFKNLKKFKNNFKFDDYILCVGRIEPRKNQLSIIQAVKELREEENLNLQLVLIGKKGKLKHFEYNKRFCNELQENKWIHHANITNTPISYENMPSYYKYAKVCVSASWFETTGLTSLEALYCGSNAVAAGDRAKEYLGKYASYCDPSDIDSIKKAIKKEYLAPRPKISDEMKNEYTWKVAAEKTYEVYKDVV